MTLQNAQRLYEHYVDNGMSAQAEDILAKRPDLKKPEKKAVKEDKPSKE
tara:strand:+ start:386 stop:532 length:147 start_codon:yes stop_codon:yes gene_type:complete